ncbi:MAG: hypothetical protein V4542_08125 [Pseudomonadota bacterium]
MNFLTRIWTFSKSGSGAAILGIGGLLFGFYSLFVYEKKGELAISVNAITRVFDIRQPVGGLEVSYAGENLRTSKKALWAVNFSIKNIGNAEVKKGDFDDEQPFGLRFTGAQVVETPTKKANEDYLERGSKLWTSTDTVAIAPVIFEVRDELQVSVLLLGSDVTPPGVSAVGKIAGTKSIQVFDIDKQSDQSLWYSAFVSDRWPVQAMRLLFYGVLFIFSVVAALAIFASITSQFDKISKKQAKEKRRQQVEELGATDDLQKRIYEVYVEHGASLLLRCMQFFPDMAEKLESGTKVVLRKETHYRMAPDGTLLGANALRLLKERGLVLSEPSRFVDGFYGAIAVVAEKIDLYSQNEVVHFQDDDFWPGAPHEKAALAEEMEIRKNLA